MLKAGFSKIDITPNLGCCLQGHFDVRIAKKIHDLLFAKAAVFDDGKNKICIVSCDLIGIGKDEVKLAREIIVKETGIPNKNIIICATHTHTGPTLIWKKDTTITHGVDEKWLEALPSNIASAAIQANCSVKKTRVACLSGEEHGVSFNRRFLMKNGKVVTNPGICNSDIVKPVGPIDPEVGVLAFGRDYNDIDGLIANFALHTDTVDGYDVSADFPGVMNKLITNIIGDIGFVYTSGAMGDINHANVKRNPDKKYEYFEHASRIGRVLGSEVIKTVARMEKFRDDVTVSGERIQVKLPLKDYDESSIRKAREIVSSKTNCAGQDWPGHMEEFLSSMGLLRAQGLGKGEYATEITGIRIGDIAFVTVPCEYFVEFGLEIKKKSPFAKTFIIELGGDYLGYISRRESFEQGGYESTGAAFKPEAGYILREKTIELLNTLHKKKGEK
ncbi:neutral/alkaline non-lysosomal ceramidase N-terminal domain-containing protein [bacterium]|nr:neutral/alkaline non-lysosomal ceramidase N-terminal domain-containing protein [bacterium]